MIKLKHAHRPFLGYFFKIETSKAMLVPVFKTKGCNGFAIRNGVFKPFFYALYSIDRKIIFFNGESGIDVTGENFVAKIRKPSISKRIFSLFDKDKVIFEVNYTNYRWNDPDGHFFEEVADWLLDKQRKINFISVWN